MSMTTLNIVIRLGRDSLESGKISAGRPGRDFDSLTPVFERFFCDFTTKLSENTPEIALKIIKMLIFHCAVRENAAKQEIFNALLQA